jgi:hypothetical protein
MIGWRQPAMPASEYSNRPLHFRVRFRGTLSASWFATLQDVTLSTTRTGSVTETTLTGEAPDEAALIGLVNLLYQIGCSLVLVETLADSASAGQPDTPNA